MFELRFFSPSIHLSLFLSLSLRSHLPEHIASGPAELMPGTLRRPHSTVAKAGRAKEMSGIKTLFAPPLPLPSLSPSLSLSLSHCRREREFGNTCESRVTDGHRD